MKIFPYSEIERIVNYYQIYGFVAVSGLLSEDNVTELQKAVDIAVEQDKLYYFYDSVPSGKSNHDLTFVSSKLDDLCKDNNIVSIVKKLLKSDIELQHSKMTTKPLNVKGLSYLPWHQDFPFFPHSNFDLLACSVLIDDETIDNSPVCFLPKSHKLGVLDHYLENGEFAYECTDMPDFEDEDVVPAVAPKGSVLFHHSLVLHYSDASTGMQRHRRHLVFQYRAKDALQLAGLVRKSDGLSVDESPPAETARFEVGTNLKLIGNRRKIVYL